MKIPEYSMFADIVSVLSNAIGALLGITLIDVPKASDEPRSSETLTVIVWYPYSLGAVQIAESLLPETIVPDELFQEYLSLSLSPSSATHTKSIDLLFETTVSLGVKEIIFTGLFYISHEVNIRINVKIEKIWLENFILQQY